jgi:multiple sugar transport system permease protein
LLLPWLIPLLAATTVWKWMLDEDNGVINRLLADLH